VGPQPTFKIPAAFWPPPEAMWRPRRSDQSSDGIARCTAFAVCDEEGGPVAAGHEGQAVHVLFEFDVGEGIEVPSGWFELRNAEGLLIHGKSSVQEERVLAPGSTGRLRYRYVVHLDVAPGEYYWTVGLSSLRPGEYTAYWLGEYELDRWPTGRIPIESRAERYRQAGLTEEGLDERMFEHCRVSVPTPFSVGLDSRGRRPSSGLASLRSSGAAIGLPKPVRRARARESTPTVIHVTHYKAGSQWIYGILRGCLPGRVAEPDARMGHLRYWPPAPGQVYPTVYLTREQLDTVLLPPDTRLFVVIRDLRDTLVSLYFSLLRTHEMADFPSFDLRRLLGSLSTEAGLVYLLDKWFPEIARIQLSWLEAGEPLVRYEDILADDVGILEEVLLDRCGLRVPRARFREVVEANRFESLSGGRSRGVEDPGSHLRLGISGDWRSHFTPRVTEAFKARYGGLLVATGYEPSLDW